MSNLLACIIVRDKNDAGIKEMCPTGYFGRSKLLQSCINFTLKPELEPTVMACLAGRDAQELLCTGFVQTPRQFKAVAILTRHLLGRYSQDRLFRKNIYTS